MSNAWVTCLVLGDSSWKRLVIPHKRTDVYKRQHIQTVTDVVAEVGDKINLPESLTEAVKAMPDSELMSVIREYGEASVKEITIRLIALRLADIVLTAIAYLVIMVVVSIVLRVVVAATGSVSYTHLDVYKRQLYDRRTGKGGWSSGCCTCYYRCSIW